MRTVAHAEGLAANVRISTLWIFMDLALLLLLTLNDFDPNEGLKEMIRALPSQLIPEVLLGGAVVLLIPLVMALFSLATKDPRGRQVILAMGCVFTIFQFSGVAYALSRLAIAYAYLAVLQGAAFVAAVLIVWHAYKLPRGDIRG